MAGVIAALHFLFEKSNPAAVCARHRMNPVSEHSIPKPSLTAAF